nr:GGDEF domain-containing phosphodiesterase [Quadrisphaera sp. RL12-1S]
MDGDEVDVQQSAPPRRRRGTSAAAVAVALLLVWAAAWWLTRGTSAAAAVPAVGLPVLACCAAASSLLRSRRTAGVDRHLWRWLALTSLAWGLTTSSSLGRPWSPGDADAQAVSPLTLVLLPVTAVLAVTALAPVLRRSVSPANLVRDGVDNALLTAVAASVLWYAVLAPAAPAAPTGAVGPVSTGQAAVFTVELLLTVSFVHLAARTHRRHPGLALVAAGVVAVVSAEVTAAVMATSAWWPGYDVLTWSCAVMACALLAGAGSALRRDAAGAPDLDRPAAGSGLVACAAALLALATSVPASLIGHDASGVGAWLHLAVLSLLVVRALLLAHDGNRLTRDLEQRVSARTQALASAERRFASLVVHSTDAVAVVGVDGRCRYVSPSFERVFGVRPDQLLGRPLDALVTAGPEAVDALHDALRSTLHEPASRQELRTTARHVSGRPLVLDVTLTNLVDDPAVRGVVVNTHDVTDAVRLEEELSSQAFSDALTGLPNRALFRDRLEHALRSRGARSDVEVCYLDLDGFKAVNDTLGHGAGDELLVAVAERLRTVVRQGDTVARLGGDEFAVLLDEAAGEHESERLAQRLCDAVRRPFTVRGTQVHVATSVGLASSASTGPDASQLLRSADLAMYQAKGQRQGGYARYHPRMHEQLAERVQLEADLHRAVEHQQLRVVYQPLVDMSTGGVTGVEALVRWHHPQRGVIAPVTFIPLAEATGLIDAIGAHVLREACQQVSTWRAEVPGAETMRLSVNLSAHQLDHPGLLADVVAVLDETGLPATSLVLEITESALIDQHDAALQTLHALRALGIRLAIDDFGTGYSSLSYLHRLPVDILKIDKSFVDRLSHTGDASLVDAILGMAATLGLTTVAEGIEHAHQRHALAAQGCATGQGYHFSPPVDASEVPDLITTALGAVTGDPAAPRSPVQGLAEEAAL